MFSTKYGYKKENLKEVNTQPSQFA